MDDAVLKKKLDNIDSEIGNLHEKFRELNNRCGGDVITYSEVQTLRERIESLERQIKKLEGNS